MEEPCGEHKFVRVFRKQTPVTVLGPGQRAVVWVQGCPFACRNCIVPDSWDMDRGHLVSIAELAGWVLEQPELEGITLSGGEPMAQAGGLVQLIDRIRNHADLGVVCYTGYTHNFLKQRGTPPQQQLLARVDLLIDGAYQESLHGDRLWRGSTNQRLVPLTDRYLSICEQLSEKEDRSAGLEFFIDSQGVLTYVGVPPRPGFDRDLRAQLRARGVILREIEEAPI